MTSLKGPAQRDKVVKRNLPLLQSMLAGWENTLQGCLAKHTELKVQDHFVASEPFSTEANSSDWTNCHPPSTASYAQTKFPVSKIVQN